MIAAPLRYVGSRNSTWRDLLSLAPLDWTCFREPFTGSASMLLYLPKCKAWINDLNPAITNFHRTLRDDPDFIPRVMERVRELDTEAKLRAEFERVKTPFVMTRDPWATFMLDRFAVKTSFGFHRKDIASFCSAYGKGGFKPWTEASLRHARASLLRHETRITTGDYSALLTATAAPGERPWIFVDPPYRMDHHASPYYEKMFTDDDHRLLAARLKECPFDWLLTINRDDVTEELYGPLGEVSVHRYDGCNVHAQYAGYRTELIVRRCNDDA